MKTKPSPIERIADLLPDEQREKFLVLSTRFKTLPEDDEFLLALELICYSTLIWHQVPERLQSLLEKANPVAENTHSIAGELKEALVQEIPSCGDLRDLSFRLVQLEKNLGSAIRQLQKERKRPTGWSGLLMLVGIALGYLAPRIASLLF